MSHNAHGAQLALRVLSGLNTLPAACVVIHRTFSTTLTHDLIHCRSLHSLTSHSSLKVPHSLSSSEVVFMLIPNPEGKCCVFMGCLYGSALNIFILAYCKLYCSFCIFFYLPHLLLIYTISGTCLCILYLFAMLYYT